MSTHTPGPWRVNGYTIEIQRMGARVATACPYGVAGFAPVTREEAAANTRLIAAAPDMLAVLQELEESAGYWGEYDVPLGIVDRIRDAIAKATGGAT